MQNEATYLDMTRRYQSSFLSDRDAQDRVKSAMKILGLDANASGRIESAGHRSMGYTDRDDMTMTNDPNFSLLLPLLILLSTLLFLLIFCLVFLIVLKRKRRRGIALTDNDGPLDLAREEELEGEGGLQGVEQRWLEQQDENVRIGYERAKIWQQQYLPNSMPTDITLSQFLSIQEKGVSAWSFEPDYETNSPLFVTSRTEITFLEDGIGMAAEEGGACCVQSNLPLPRLNEVYYWECKLFEKPEATQIAIGLSTKPYPSFRMPGWNRYSIGYFSVDGFKSHNYPFTAQSYGPPLSEGDVLGVGYRPRTGTVFFTRNGKKLEDAYIGLTKHNLFPTVAANGAATIHVNLGQAGFVFIEANVKKWGLAPMIGTLAPPPAYGSERGSILLETATGQVNSPPDAASPIYNHHHQTAQSSQPNRQHQRQRSNEQLAVAALSNTDNQDQSSSSSSSRNRGSSHRRQPSTSTAPIRPSPLRTSVTRQQTSSSVNSDASSPMSIPGTEPSPPVDHGEREADGPNTAGAGEIDEEDLPLNPPTPGQLDISLRAMSPFSRRAQLEDREGEREHLLQRQNDDVPVEGSSADRAPITPTSSTPPYNEIPNINRFPINIPGDVSPPSYQLLDANQYPAGVAEVMLSEMPEEQLNALFAAAHTSNSAANGARGSGLSSAPSSVGGTSYEGRTAFEGHHSHDDPNGTSQGLGLGLRGLLGSMWRRPENDSEA